jgi:putative ATP-dependent endonuclease of OLD family
LLFGRRAILVEGIAEAILLPCIAKHSVLTNNAEGLKRFKGTLTTPIEGVDFEPYVLLLLKCSVDGARIADRVIVITDGDPDVKGNRKEHLEAVAKKLGGEMALTVKVNKSTLEQELFAEGNEHLLMKSYLTLRPKSGQKWKDLVQGRAKAERPAAFLKLLADSRIRKGDLAQEIARRIERGAMFNVPGYLKEAIEKAAEE